MWLLILLLFCTNAIAGIVTVNTGYGYLTDSKGHIVGKCNYSSGQVAIRDDYTYTEVPDQNTLNSIQIWVDPSVLAQQQLDALRQQKLKALADAQLVSDPTAMSLKAQGAK